MKFPNLNPPGAICFASVSLFLAAAGRAATTASLNPAADAFLSSANPAGNFGGGGALGISAAGLPKGELQGLMRFDFATAKSLFDTTYGPGGWVLDSISLRITAAAAANPVFNTSAGGTLSVRWFDDDTWTEGTGTPSSPAGTGVNYNSLASLLTAGSGAQAAGSLVFDGSTSGNHFIALSAAGLAADVLAGSTASINLYAGDAAVSGVFNSRSFNSSANWPLLTVTASPIPEPSAVVFGAFALVVPMLFRNRKDAR